MSERETALRDMGFELYDTPYGGEIDRILSSGEASLAFSGYGEFTPITIRSETIIKDANMERSQSRD